MLNKKKIKKKDNELKESNEGEYVGVVGSLLNMVTSFTYSHPSRVKCQMASSLIDCWTVFYLTIGLRARVFYERIVNEA